MKATEILRSEHELIETGLKRLAALARRLEPEGSALTEPLSELLKFFHEFADASHHAKEELSLFPALAEAGLPMEGGPLGVMMAEHDSGREFLAAMDETISKLDKPEARDRFIEAADRYVHLLGQHIYKENNILFRIAEDILSEAEQRELTEAFARHELERLGAAKRAHFERLLASAP